jgi:hypothetical protein
MRQEVKPWYRDRNDPELDAQELERDKRNIDASTRRLKDAYIQTHTERVLAAKAFWDRCSELGIDWSRDEAQKLPEWSQKEKALSAANRDYNAFYDAARNEVVGSSGSGAHQDLSALNRLENMVKIEARMKLREIGLL